MIDTHSHILPGLDDGASDLSQALGFISLAAGQGVTAMFATSHCCDGVYNCDKNTILAACRDLCTAAEKSGIDMRILPGAEIRVNHDLVAQFDAGHLLTLGNAGRFLLLELPPMFIAHAVLRMTRQLREREIIPIIAHAERNPMVAGQPGLAAELIYQGARLQITAASLAGDFGRPALKSARTFAENGQVFCLGSDIHPGRKYQMKTAQKNLNKWIGREQTGKLLIDNPEQIFYGCFDPVESCGLGRVGI
ncbi:MAG: tyrosine protein phosphatase [Desulfotignum sp.]|nr:tyrosine protein phosphatase [Desulfotignum sp.]